MDSFFQNKSQNVSALEEQFKNWHFSCFDVSIKSDGEQYIKAFCCQTNRLNSLQQEWSEINSFIAATLLPQSRSSFEGWNTYLLFVCTDKDKLPRSTHYEIENNKFSMKKIVIQKQAILKNDEVAAILNCKILSSEIELIQEVSETPENPQLSEITTRLLSADINTKNASKALEGRKNWLGSELKRIGNNEN